MARRKPKTYPHLKLAYSPVNQQWFVLWPGRNTPVERQQVLAKFGTLGEAEEYADRVSSKADNPTATVYHETGSFRDGTLHVYKKIYSSLSAAKKGAREHSATVDGYVTVLRNGIEVAQFRQGKEVPYRGDNPRVRTTEELWIVQGNYGHGWEDVTAAKTWKEIKQNLREYRENEPGTAFRAIKRRVKIAAPQNNPQPWARVFG